MTKQKMIEKLVELGVNAEELENLSAKQLQAKIKDMTMSDEKKAEQEQKKVEKSRVQVYNINAMAPVIAAKRGSNTRSVITKSMCEALDVSEDYFKAWVADVKNLWKLACRANIVADSPTSTADDIKQAEQELTDAWADIMSNAEPEKYARSLHVIPNCDAHFLMYHANYVFVDTEEGLNQANAGENYFRSRVENYLGVRQAGCSILDDADRQLIDNHNAAKKAVKTITDNISRADDQIESAQKEVDRLNEFIDRIPADNTMFIDYVTKERDAKIAALKSAKDDRDTLKNDLKTAQKELENAKQEVASVYETMKTGIKAE